MILVTVLGVVPSFVLLMTSYPRIFIVLSFLRRALGTPELPPQQVMAGLALILTGLVMFPVWRQVHTEAYLPFSRGELKTPEEALEKAGRPIKSFLLAHTYEKDLKLFVELSATARGDAASSPGEAGGGAGREATVEELSFFVVLPAFVLSELKTAFQIGFLIYLPFLVIDLAVAAVLLSMGMFLLPPALVSLPLKVLVFVLVDGWDLVVVQLVQGFQVLG
jgi:flagellar biosynthetic protein FliP